MVGAVRLVSRSATAEETERREGMEGLEAAVVVVESSLVMS